MNGEFALPSFEESVFHLGRFSRRHLGSHRVSIESMLSTLGCKSLEHLIEETIPEKIRWQHTLNLPAAATEEEALAELKELMSRNQLRPTYLGMGYYGTLMPAVIRRNILENPGWYTAYTPYQAEISQGRLEALLNFQTMVSDLTGLAIANASMLDEATAAAEAMAMCFDNLHSSSTENRDQLRRASARSTTDDLSTQPLRADASCCSSASANLNTGSPLKNSPTFFVDSQCHPQTIAVLRTRSEPLGIKLCIGTLNEMPESNLCGSLIQYPATDGSIDDPEEFVQRTHQAGGLSVMACDPLALVLIKSPGELGADIAIGSTQRFGVPMGYGGPHAAFLAVREELKRRLPGRLVGVSRDAEGNMALRLTLQTREQHIRREKATSNICTAQVLLAVIASMYAVYHGPHGLSKIAQEIHLKALQLASLLTKAGWNVASKPFFDTVRIDLSDDEMTLLQERAHQHKINLRFVNQGNGGWVSIALDETTTSLEPLIKLFDVSSSKSSVDPMSWQLSEKLRRKSSFLTHPVFHRYHTETEMLRYLRHLESKDLSLTASMIPLGSCTMKLNATSEMLPLTWETISQLHPFVPVEQAQGYQEMFHELERWLAAITGFHAVSLQPNAGSQGEYAGLLVIRAYHCARGETERNVCLIPHSAHGTNPASAAMAGMKVVGVACDAQGNIDVADFYQKVATHRDQLAAFMITYPSTHGVFEASVQELCAAVHEAGGQVYMDGANMNAQVGLSRPHDLGADVCHLNLHKTFCIPHGGGGPGVGPIGVAEHLAPYLPGHSMIATGGNCAISEVSAAPWGSASICVISWMYLRMMGPDGLTVATKLAILHANYIAKRLEKYFPILYRGERGRVAHECILDLREWKQRAGIEVEDVAKRLIDYGFHAPTMSWPVPGTLMVEPTESESQAEIDRFCEAMIAIHGELIAIEEGKLDRVNNPLKRAPHTAQAVTANDWNRPYSREQAAYPVPGLRKNKFWSSVARVDNVYGDRNIFCSCPAVG